MSATECDDIVILEIIRRNIIGDVDFKAALQYVIQFLSAKNRLFETKHMHGTAQWVSVGSTTFDWSNRWAIENTILRLLRIYECVLQWSATNSTDE
jgi:hypothetical protein